MDSQYIEAACCLKIWDLDMQSQQKLEFQDKPNSNWIHFVDSNNIVVCYIALLPLQTCQMSKVCPLASKV